MTYTRRSVEKDVEEFDGWEKIVELCLRLENRRDRALYSCIYLTCGRIMEVLRLRRRNFTFSQDAITVEKMLLLKRYEKDYGYLEYRDELPEDHTKHLWTWDPENRRYYRMRYETTLKTVYRKPFDIPSREPMAVLLANWVRARKDFIFPGRARDERFPEMDRRHLSYQRAYEIITSLGIYPHYLRGQRASCLKAFYNLPDGVAMEWAGWENPSTFAKYSRMGRVRIAGMMDREYPREALERARRLR